MGSNPTEGDNPAQATQPGGCSGSFAANIERAREDDSDDLEGRPMRRGFHPLARLRRRGFSALTPVALASLVWAAALIVRADGIGGLVHTVSLGTAGVLTTITLIPVAERQMRAGRHREVRRAVLEEVADLLGSGLIMRLGFGAATALHAELLARATEFAGAAGWKAADPAVRCEQALVNARRVLGPLQVLMEKRFWPLDPMSVHVVPKLTELVETTLPALVHIDLLPEVLELRLVHLRRASAELAEQRSEDVFERLAVVAQRYEAAASAPDDDAAAEALSAAVRDVETVLVPYARFATALHLLLDHIEWDRRYPARGGMIDFGP